MGVRQFSLQILEHVSSFGVYGFWLWNAFDTDGIPSSNHPRCFMEKMGTTGQPQIPKGGHTYSSYSIVSYYIPLDPITMHVSPIMYNIVYTYVYIYNIFIPLHPIYIYISTIYIPLWPPTAPRNCWDPRSRNSRNWGCRSMVQMVPVKYGNLWMVCWKINTI